MKRHGKWVLRDGTALFELILQPGEWIDEPLPFGGTHDALSFLRRCARDALSMHVLRAAFGDGMVGLGGARLDDAQVVALFAERLARGWIHVVPIPLPRLTGLDGEREEEAVPAPPPRPQNAWIGEEDLVEPPLWAGDDVVVEPPLWAGAESIVEPLVGPF